ncbi:hypothetical protein GOP47_0011323 [Adiantum capillus-veneris]|uniref:Uncharacterized protein n=1 Tax=Adiantum capillus-veneris TaxID=13818 RepID=A0A9D4UT08_ADICA|nr:hypothetical protein GOP47_0011323 [Adiantum capillus-veneris]
MNDAVEARSGDAISAGTSASSFSSALSSSDLDTESSTSFFRERSITLGSLIGIDGESILANNDHDQVEAPHNRAISVLLPQSATSSQSFSFTCESGIRGGAKLYRLLSCGACKQLRYTNRDTWRVLWCSKKDSAHARPPATAIFSASLGRLLIAERDAERLQERDVDGENNGARVYINIMYEENAGLEQVANNPLFDVHSSSTGQVNSTSAAEQELQHCRQPQNASNGLTPSPSFCVEDGPRVKIVERIRRTVSTPRRALEAHECPPTVPLKSRKRLPTSLCELGCVSHMWTKCRV